MYQSWVRFSTTPKQNPPFSLQNLKWISHISTNIPNLKLSLTHFFNSLSNPTTNSNQNYELEIVSALKSCSTLKAILQGQQIHTLVIKKGFNSNIFIQNSLISMYVKNGHLGIAEMLYRSCSSFDLVSCNVMLSGYVKSGRVSHARQVFDEMPERGLVAYTTMIMGYAQNGMWGEGLEVFKDMRFVGVAPNEVTLSSVISCYCHVGRIRDGGGMHCLSVKLGLHGFVLVSTNLLHMYCNGSCLDEARRLFDGMLERNIVSWNVMLNGYSKMGLVDLAKELFDHMPDKDVVSWGTIIDAYVRKGRLREALILYRSMLCAGVKPNDVMVVDIVSGCGQVMAITEGQQLHCTMIKSGFDCFDFIQSNIIHFYSTCCRIDLACVQFEVASKAHIASWNALVSGFIRNRMIDRARQLFDEMPKRDIFSWSSIISGYSQSEQAGTALEMFQRMVHAGIQPNEITMVSVLSAIASLGSLKDAKWAHDYIENNSIHLNDNLIAALIDVYAKCGSVSNALDVFNPVRDKVTTVSPWNAIICGLAMHGHATLALTKFEDLERTGIQPNSITFIGVLTACCHVGLVEAGEMYFERMKNVYKIKPNIKHYGCMVDLLSRAGRIQEADEMIRSMPMEADVVIWGTLLAACKTHGNMEIGERAAKNLASLDASHGASRVLLSNLYADAGRWGDALGVRKAMQGQQMIRSPGASGVA